MSTRHRFILVLMLMAFVLAVIETTTGTSFGSATPNEKDLIHAAKSSSFVTKSLVPRPDGSANFDVQRLARRYLGRNKRWIESRLEN